MAIIWIQSLEQETGLLLPASGRAAVSREEWGVSSQQSYWPVS